MDEPKYKSTVAIVMKNGAQVSTKSICVPQFLWDKFNSNVDPIWFDIEVGDKEKNWMKLRRESIDLISIMNYIDEKEAARKSGLIVPDRSGGGIRRVQ